MYYNDYITNIISSRADYRLFFDTRYQNIVNDAIQDLLDREPLGWQPDSLWIDADNNVLHLFNMNDRENTERTINL